MDSAGLSATSTAVCYVRPSLSSRVVIFFFCFSLRFTFLFLNDGVAIRFSSLCLFLLLRSK